jgi:hypothetical protein
VLLPADALRVLLSGDTVTSKSTGELLDKDSQAASDDATSDKLSSAPS